MPKLHKLDITLIERTKLLEGIMCQSLTFTNAKGKQWGEGDVQNPSSALTYKNIDLAASGVITESEANTIFGVDYYKTPVLYGNTFQIISPRKIKRELEAQVNIGTYTADVTLNYTVDGVVKTANNNDVEQDYIAVTPNQSLGLKYTCDGSYYYSSDVPGSLPVTYTETFEYQYVIGVVENRYPLKPYSITDCICRCLELAYPLKLGELPKYKLQGVNYTLNGNGTFTRTYGPGSQASKFDKIPAPNFTMTQCTLREQLKVIGGFIHSEPRLGYDPDGTGLNYEENTIIFERYEKEQDTNLGERGYVYRGVSQSLNNYCTSVTTNVANLVNTINYADGAIKEPNENLYNTLRTDSINVMLSESNGKIKTLFPVYDVIKVECTIFNSNTGEPVGNYDITPYVFEKHEYDNLSSNDNTYPYAKAYAIYYTQGQKGLDGLFFKNEGASADIFRNYAIKNIIDSVSNTDFDSANNYQKIGFRVTYIPIHSSMFSHGKSLIQDGNNNFTIPYAQGENLVESSYYGEHLKGIAAKMGNIEQVRTYILPDVSYLPKAGQTLDGYVIASVKHDLRHTHVKCTVALTKDFNRLSQYVGVSSHKRVSEVSEREAYARDILIKEYAVIGDNQASDNTYMRNGQPIISAITNAYPSTFKPITAVVCAGTPKRYYKPTGSPSVDYYNSVALPVISSAFGNVMVFSWTYKDNYSAIERLTTLERIVDNDTVKGTYQTDIPYCDYYGRLHWYDFTLVQDLIPVTNEFQFANGATSQNGVFKYPDSGHLDYIIRTSVYNSFNRPVLVEKDSREALNINYQIEVITNRKDLIIGSAIAQKCGLVGAEIVQNAAKVYFFKGYKFDKYPRSLAEVDLTKKVAETVIVTSAENYFSFSVDVAQEFDSWCIAYPQQSDTVIYSDENGNTVPATVYTGGEITLACNNTSAYYDSKNATNETIYVNMSNTNLKGV